MKLKDIILAPGVRALLEANGHLDAQSGTSMHDGWEAIRADCGYERGRTPASEAYEDGWYAGAAAKK